MQQLTQEIVSAVLPILLPAIAGYIAVLLRSWLRTRDDSEAALAINTAVARAAAIVYQRAAVNSIPLTDTHALDLEIRRTVGETRGRIGGALEKRGVDFKQMEDMVRGDFARIAAADPTVAGPPVKPE